MARNGLNQETINGKQTISKMGWVEWANSTSMYVTDAYKIFGLSLQTHTHTHYIHIHTHTYTLHTHTYTQHSGRNKG